MNADRQAGWMQSLEFMHYDFVDLKVFLAVADAGNLSRGARRVHLAPSSVSLRIKRLEEAMGARLLVRGARGVSLTPAGRVMADHARRCVALLEQMRSDMQPFSQRITRRITFFANNNAISSYLPDDLARFFARFPDVRIILEEHPSHEIVDAVAAARADIGVVALDQTHPDLEFLPYRQDQLVMLMPKSSGLAATADIHFADCMGEPFISLQQGTALHTFLVGHAAALGGRLDVRVQVSGYRAIARLVASGAGIGVVPRSALEPADQQYLAVVGLKEAWSRRDLRICIRRERRHAQDFLADLVDNLCAAAGLQTSTEA